ncbi:hypothetical protein Q5424_04450 [Conexibacter sp. JD483]|uniref:hypothetical protein n=1 Tax=unclassified Conexibacter TaxID=2627773 RepID=UPI002716D57D|nr:MULTISPECIES: hypothetical protein [unclassified Conexibacter]MDO8184349.1 hypothetical protein [Conexibacter sp. CPCC 205706]MDO8197655.1 hypothetical protein [Conexibacter sp. CPCC 205762]MDR9368318.1 hypothetical protein [Conexibacter sp. JD483]
MTDRLSRRQLLARGAAAGAAFALAGCGDDGPPAPTAPAPTPPVPTTATTALVPLPSERMLKGVSLIGDVNPYDDSLGVRQYLLGGARPTEVVTLWAVWPALQPTAPEPRTREAAFAQLSAPADPEAAAGLDRLDAQIAQANADGRRVGLTLYQAFPEWTHPATLKLDPRLSHDLGGPGFPGAGRRGTEAHIPDDRSDDGPWAWFVEWCCARWADTGGAPSPGPGIDGATAGNPRSARIDWLQPLNEPNLAWWPQTSDRFPAGTIASAVAEMVRSAATVAARWRTAAATPRGPELLIPNTADVVADAGGFGTPWRDFTSELLRALSGWVAPLPVGWSQHNYADVKYGPQQEGPGAGRWRAQEAIDLLGSGAWPDPGLWLTEGGYQFGVTEAAPQVWRVDPAKVADPASADVFAEQVAKLQANWEAMEQLPVRLWTQYFVNDKDVRFQSSLRGPVRVGPDGVRTPNDPPYPAADLWPRLGA